MRGIGYRDRVYVGGNATREGLQGTNIVVASRVCKWIMDCSFSSKLVQKYVWRYWKAGNKIRMNLWVKST